MIRYAERVCARLSAFERGTGSCRSCEVAVREVASKSRVSSGSEIVYESLHAVQLDEKVSESEKA